MDRRIFIKSLLGVAGAVATVTALAPSAHALPLLDELQAMDAKGVNPLNVATSEADLPAEGATEAQYYYGPRRRYYRRRYYRPVYRRPIRRCRSFVNRAGRLVRRCWVG